MKTLLIKEWKEQWRTHRLLILLIVFSVFGILSPLAARFMPAIIENMTTEQGIEIKIPDPLWTDAVLQYLKNISQICTFILIILSMGVIAKEKESGTIIFLFVKPVRRSSFILAKFLIQFLSSFIAMLSASLLCIFYTMIFFGEMDVWAFLKIHFVLYFFVLIIQSITLFYSTLLKSSLTAGLMSFLTWLLLGLLSQLGRVGQFSPSKLISEAGNILIGTTMRWEAFAGSAILLTVLLLISLWHCSRWETE